MHKVPWIMSVFAALLVLFPPTAKAQSIDEPLNLVNITLLADPSLIIPLTEITREYARQEKVMVSIGYGPGKEHARNIEQGQEADVYITSRLEWINSLKLQGLIDVYSQVRIAQNKLALVGSSSSKTRVSLAPEANLALLLEGKEPNAFFAVGDPEYVAQGEFAKEALTELELYNQLEPFFVFLRDEYQVMNTISKFEVYGITYLTEVTKNPKLKVIDIFPDSSHDPIYYDAVVVAGENMPPARKFVEYLAQPEAQAIFVKHGLGLKNL